MPLPGRFDGTSFLATLPWVVVGSATLLAATFALALIVRRHSVIDTTWGLLFAVIAAITFAGSSGHGDLTRRWLLLVLPVLWGCRLAVHLARRTIGRPEDPRYRQLLARAHGSRELYALRMIYGLQGLLALMISAPLQIGAYEQAAVGPLAWVGVGVWGVGITWEAVADWQLERWRRDPAHAGTVIDIGLWRYSRHPNYFGDACAWWGMFLVAADAWPGALTVAAPVLMTLLLTRGSGVRVLEAHLAGRPGWAEYVARTSTVVPRPPRRPRL